MWPIIRIALKASAAPTADTGEEKLSNILRALLSGKATCWVTGDERKPKTMIIVTISDEEISGTRNMLIYCAHGFEKERAGRYVSLLTALKNYAIDRGCDNIISYVWNDRLKKLLEAYGADCKYTLAVFPLIKKFNKGE
jgi:hypothetical protein